MTILYGQPALWKAMMKKFKQPKLGIRNCIKNSRKKQPRKPKKSNKPAAFVFWVPSGMKAAVSTTSCAAVPDDKAILEKVVFTFRWKMT